MHTTRFLLLTVATFTSQLTYTADARRSNISPEAITLRAQPDCLLEASFQQSASAILFDAIFDKDYMKMQYAIRIGADVNAKHKDITPLALTAHRSMLIGTTILLAAGADVNARMLKNHTALTYVLHKKPNCVEKHAVVASLIAAGATAPTDHGSMTHLYTLGFMTADGTMLAGAADTDMAPGYSIRR